MRTYQNISGRSGVKAFAIADKFIIVLFNNDKAYHYSYAVSGISSVEQMKALALSGLGLNTFINQHVRKHYATRLN